MLILSLFKPILSWNSTFLTARKTCGGGGLILAFLTFFGGLLSGPAAVAQCGPSDLNGDLNCRTLNCADQPIKIQLEKDFSNVAQDCPASAPCGDGDQFRQLFFKVRLKFTPKNANDQDLCFHLAYSMLHVGLRLQVTKLGGGPTFSHIDVPATRKCYQTGPGSNWGNTQGGTNVNVAQFDIYPAGDSAVIDFLNQNLLSPCDGDVIPFTAALCDPGNPNSGMCSFYLEFMAKVAEQSPVGSVTSSGGYGSAAVKSGSDWFVHFKVPASINLSSMQSASLGKIIIVRPPLQNQAWAAFASLVEPDKSRAKIFDQTGAFELHCSSLILDGAVQSCSQTGTVLCGSSSPFAFRLLKPENASAACPSDKTMRLGLYSSDLNVSSVTLRRLAFSVKFNLRYNAKLTSANVGSLCPSGYNAPQNACFPPLEGAGTSPCYRFTDSTFSFCFDLSNAANPYTINLGNGGGYITLTFNDIGCIDAASLTYLEMDEEGNTSVCVPRVDALPNPFALCPPQIDGRLATEADSTVEEAVVRRRYLHCSTTCPADSVVTGKDGVFGFCPCTTCTVTLITPFKNDAPLNGVSTSDLVLINKHLLGLASLSSPYKMIAADANKKGDITPFDVVELRKLILGIYTKLPVNTSWRFVLKSYVFPDPTDPFKNVFPETDTITNANGYHNSDFVAIKVGDMNGSAVAHVRPAKRPKVSVIFLSSAAKSGSILTVPVVYAGPETLEAIQLGLRFDPARLKLIGPSKGDLPAWGADNFGLTKAEKGEIRTLWFAPSSQLGPLVKPGTVLFYLSFQALQQLSDGDLPLTLDDAVLPNAAWRPDGRECEVAHDSPALKGREPKGPALRTTLRAICQPNPTSGEAALLVESDRAGRARIVLYGAFGKLIAVREVQLEKGSQRFDLPELDAQPTGIYLWSLLSEGEKTTGSLVKQ